MARVIVGNAFSLNMLPVEFAGSVDIRPAIGLDHLLMGGRAPINAIGHETTDAVVRNLLAMDGINLPVGQRMTVSLEAGDVLLVAQYTGPRLAEGTTVLPVGARIEWKEVRV